jgi:hypothetical protein
VATFVIVGGLESSREMFLSGTISSSMQAFGDHEMLTVAVRIVSGPELHLSAVIYNLRTACGPANHGDWSAP